MEAIILSKEQFDALMSKIDDIHHKINSKNLPKQEVFLDNEEFIKMLKFHEELHKPGVMKAKYLFSQVGNKIYYKLSDVEKRWMNTIINPFLKMVIKQLYFPSNHQFYENINPQTPFGS